MSHRISSARRSSLSRSTVDLANRDSSSPPADESSIVEDTGDGFRVAQLARANPSVELREREAAGGDALVGLGPRRSRPQALGGVEEHALADEAGSREDVEQFVETSRGVARLLEQFTPRPR